MEASLGKMPTTLVRRLISPLTRSRGLVDQSLVQCAWGKAREGEQVARRVGELGGDVGELGAQGGGDLAELGPDVGGVGLGEDRPDGGRHHLGLGPGHLGQDVAHEVDPAPLPGRPDEDLGDGGFEPEVVIGDDELDTAEAPGAQALEKGGPKGPVLGVAHLDAEHLSVPVAGDPGRHDDRSRDHPAAHPALHVGGVAEDIGEPRHGPGAGAVGTRSSSLSRPAQMRLTSDLEIPEAAPSALTRSSTLRVETPWT